MKINIEIDLNHLEARLLQIGDVYDDKDIANNTYLSEVVRNMLIARAVSNLNRAISMARQSRQPVMSQAVALAGPPKPLVIKKAKPNGKAKPIVWNNLPNDR